MRTGTWVALLALGLSLGTPAAAQPVDEFGASIWHTVSVFEGFGFRETIAVHGDTALNPTIRLRPGLRATSAGEIQGSALRQPTVATLGSFHEISPSFSILAGGETGPLRIQGGLGLSYNMRIVLTQDSVVGFPIIPSGSTSFGTIKQLGMTFDPGVDAVVEAGFAIPLGFRLVVGFGASVAGARLVVQTREDPSVEISVPKVMLHWTFQLGLRWNLKGWKPPPPTPDAPTGPP